MSGVEPTGWNETWRYLAVGLCAALGTYRVLSHVLEQTTYELDQSQQTSKKRSRRHAWYGTVPGAQNLPPACQELLNSNSVNFESISQLALKSDHRLRKAAAELLFDNAMSPEMLALIVKTATDNTDMRLRAVTLIRQIAQTSTRRRSKIAKAGGIAALVDGLRAREDHELALRSGWALMEFLGTQDAKLAKRFRRKAASCGLLEVVYEILESLGKEEEAAVAAEASSSDNTPSVPDPRDLSLLGVCFNITKIYALRSAFHKQMVDLGYLPVLLCVAKNSVASLEYMRIVMESIVRLCTYLSAFRSADTNYAINPRMTQLLDLGAVDVIAACIRQDDQSVSSWGIGLLHEFVSRGVGKQQLAASPRIVQWLCRKLSTTKYAYTNQLILRSLWCLGTTNKAALVDASQPPNLRRILNMFASGNDTEAHYWSIALVSRIAVYPSSHLWILSSPLPQALKVLLDGLAPNLRVTLFPEIANIISRMCHSIPLAPVLCTHPEIAETCCMLLNTDIETAQLATIMAIINATASSREFLKLVVDDGMCSRLFELMLDFRHEHIQTYAAKCLVALMYNDFVPATELVDQGFLPCLNELCDKYWAVLGAASTSAIEDVGERDESSTWVTKRLCQSMSTASVLFSALQVYLAELERDHGYCLHSELAVDAVAALSAFQMCLLAQISTYIMHVFDLGKAMHEYALETCDSQANVGPGILTALRKPPALHCKAEWARTAVNCFVATYYLRSPSDPHFLAAIEDSRRIVCKSAESVAPIDVGTDASDSCWVDVAIPRLNEFVSDESASRNDDEDGAEPAFTGDMRSPRLRCAMPIIRATLATLADSLEPKLMVQTPGVTRRVLWLVRILYHEFPTLRAITMRLLSVIDTRSLSKSDAAGLAHMCCSFLADTLTGARGLVVDAEQQDTRKSILELVSIVGQISVAGSDGTIASNDEHGRSGDGEDVSAATEASDRGSELEWREWQRNLASIGIAPEGARQPSEYYELHQEQEPRTVALEGWFHARYALDRHVFGWETCIEHYSCVAPPLVAAHGSDCWMIDRSGPRGPLHQRAGVEFSSTVANAPLDEDQGGPALGDDAIQLTERAVARFSADALPLIGSPLSQFGHPSHSSASSATSISSNGSNRRRTNRPESPFPTTIFSDPSVDADGNASNAVSRPLCSMFVSPPKVLYYNQTPFFPAFVTLADGYSVWNSSWKFESVRMRTGVDGRLGGVHRFQVQLLTPGLIQVGWCTDQCNFYPESGEGVGDDFESVAYDGYRQRKWHGTAEEKEYGEKWRAGDVITAELDLDSDRVVFYRNGESLGVAFGVNDNGDMEGSECGFKGLARDRTWYPAFSLASEQGLVFLGTNVSDHSHSDNSSSHSSHSSQGANASCASANDDGAVEPVATRRGSKHGETNQESIADMVRELSALGVVKAFKIRFEFQDLDTFPCIALSLPGNGGQITLGPLTNMEHLSTYLQPQWWAVWTQCDSQSTCPSVRGTSAPDLAQWFSGCVAGGPGVQMSAMLTNNMAPASWIYFAVLADGRVCVAATRGSWPSSEEDMPVLFDTGGSAANDDGNHVWLPVAMFKKFNLQETMSGQNSVKSSVVRGIRSKLLEQFPGLEPCMDDILPKKANLIQIKCKDHITLYAVDGEVMFFQHFNDPITPTLRLLHQYPEILPRVQVDRGAIKFVLSGANI
ncbi:translation machinery-associated protein 20, partial [Coemansia sp. S2]